MAHMVGLFRLVLSVSPSVYSPTALQTTELVPFHDTYDIGIATTLHIVGYEPASALRHPLYVLVLGSHANCTLHMPEALLAREMAARGFAAAIVQIPGQRFTDDILDMPDAAHCEGSNRSLLNMSQRVFAYSGSGDTSPSAIATLCRRPSIACERGIAVHGVSLVSCWTASYLHIPHLSRSMLQLSSLLCAAVTLDHCTQHESHDLLVKPHTPQGALLGELAPRFAVGITAMLTYSAGNLVAGGKSCCGIFSNNVPRTNRPPPAGGSALIGSGRFGCCEQFSCCVKTDPPTIGGTPLECLLDASTSQYLDRSRRRMVVGADDMYDVPTPANLYAAYPHVPAWLP